jgi:putative restriction endonuclease
MANNWQEDELLLTLHLYCRAPFGKLHQSNPNIIQLAQIIGRTPSAVAIKACSFKP